MISSATSPEQKVLKGAARLGGVAYSLLEIAVGAFTVVTGVSLLLGGVPLFDGLRRLYRNMPKKIKQSVFRVLTGHAPRPPKKRSGFLRNALKIGDIGISGIVMTTGMLIVMAGVIAGILSVILVGTMPMTPFVVGGALLGGAALSTMKRSYSLVKNIFPPRRLPAAPEVRPALMDKKVTPAFNGPAAPDVATPPQPTPPVAPPPVMKPPSL